MIFVFFLLNSEPEKNFGLSGYGIRFEFLLMLVDRVNRCLNLQRISINHDALFKARESGKAGRIFLLQNKTRKFTNFSL